MPKVQDFEVSGFRFGLVLCRNAGATLHCPAKLPFAVGLAAFGHRIGSAWALAKNVWPEVPFSAGPGARKPLAAVPRNATSGMGVNLNPTLGLALPPDRL